MNKLIIIIIIIIITDYTEKKPLPKIVKNRSGRSFLVKIEVSRTQLVILMNSRSKIVKNTNSHTALVKFRISRFHVSQNSDFGLH